MASRPRHGTLRLDLSTLSVGRLPLALAEQHAALHAGARVRIVFPPDTDKGTRRLLVEGAGFTPERAGARAPWLLRRLHTLPDFVAPDLRILVCGLNPSLYAAETGIPFGRPGNRFWPAARRAGLVEVDRDCHAALARGVGFTDLVKRATRTASELETNEYRAGVRRVEALVGLLRPRTICLVGLAGFRTLVERDARPGWLPAGFAGRPTYLMPSTSGLNAHSTPASLTAHLRRAARPPA